MIFATMAVLTAVLSAVPTEAQCVDAGSPEAAADLTKLLPLLAEREAAVSKFNQFIEVQTDEPLDSHDKPSHVMIAQSRVTIGAGQKEKREVLSATRDGQDVTAKRKKMVEDDEKKAASDKQDSLELSFDNPFKSSAQARYRYQLLGKSQRKPGAVRIHLEPKGKPSQNLLIGDAEVDPSTGDVLMIQARPSEFPPQVSTLDVTMTFDASTPSGLALSKVVVLGEGGFLFFRSKMRTTVTCAEHRAVSLVE